MCLCSAIPPCSSPRVISALARIILMTATSYNMTSMYSIPNSFKKLILTTFQGKRCSLYLHFAGEETEAQRSEIILSKVTHLVS